MPPLYQITRLTSGLTVASAAMDVSDGLLTDLKKLCAASGVGARIDLEVLPLSSPLVATFGEDKARQLALTGGDDYELLFTVPPQQLAIVRQRCAELAIECSVIGQIAAGDVQLLLNGKQVPLPAGGYDHFSA